MRSNSALHIFAAAALGSLSGSGSAQQLAQRTGSQSFRLMDTLWVDGGRLVAQDGTILDQVPQLLSANLTVDFVVPPGPVMTPSSRPPGVPMVSNGFMWSNLVNRAWLFGGKPLHHGSTVDNDLWRFEMKNGRGQWTQLEAGGNVTTDRPSEGAGCDVPDLQRGFYLGGRNRHGHDVASGSLATYHHFLTVFDMQNETLSTIPVPDYVPVVNQSLVFLNTATRSGALVALGGYVERNGTLSLASMSSTYVFDIESQHDHGVRSLSPFHALLQGYQGPEVLWADYQSGIPVCSMLASLATTVFTIFLGSLQLSASSYGSTTFESDLSAATASTLLAAFVLAVHLVIGYHFSWRWSRKRFLPVALMSMAAVIPYVIYSTGLREDLGDVISKTSTGDKVLELKKMDRRYGFSKVQRGDTFYYGIERHHGEPGAITPSASNK